MINAIGKAFLLVALLTANILFAGDPKLKDYPEAQKLEQEAENGDIYAMYNLAEFYDSKIGDEKKAVYWFTKRYGKIDKDSAYRIGTTYWEYGKDDKAKVWLEKAYKMGSGDAAYALGMMLIPDAEGYEDGDAPIITDEDHKLAVKYFEAAYKMGKKDAIYELVKLSANDKEAIKWYKIGYEKGLDGADYLLAKRYENLKDYPNVIKWYETAYKNALSKGRKSLAAELARDLGEVFKHLEDYPNAIKWFEIAHNDGDKLATFMLGLMYERELKDYPNAIKWYMLAGNEQKRIDEILAKEALSQQESNSTISSDLNSSK